MARITGWSVFENLHLQCLLRPFLRQVLRSSVPTSAARASPEQHARAVELASLRYPNEWHLFYVLGSKRLESNHLSASLAAASRCIQLRPNDIRSAYALATVYNALSYGGWSDETLATIRARGGVRIADGISRMREAAREQSAGIGVSPVEAARLAVVWFRRCLALGPDSWSRAQIEEHLKTLAWAYPQQIDSFARASERS